MTVAPVVANLGPLEALTLNPNPDEVSDSSPGLLPFPQQLLPVTVVCADRWKRCSLCP